MSMQWQLLAANLVVVTLFFSGWSHAQHWLTNSSPRLRSIVFGFLMGGGAVASMLLSVELRPGILFDLRTSLVAIAGFFGGPLAAIIAGTVAAAYRAGAGGGGAWARVAAIGAATVAGLVGYLLMRGRTPRRTDVLLLATAAAGASLLQILGLPSSVVGRALVQFGLPVAVLSAVATAVAGLVILQERHLARERDFLRAALTQAPDFLYVKNTKSQFAAVNQAVARYNGFDDPAQMVGKTDFDITPLERAKGLFATEQALLQAGEPVRDIEERLVDESGAETWFSTTKVPLRNRYGEVIGLAGATRDITESKRLAKETAASRDLLSYALAEMSDGLAMFDKDGHLVFSNEQYRTYFPKTSGIRKPGVHIREILRAVVESGEQLGIEPGKEQAWIDTITASLKVEGDEKVKLFDGRWLHLRNRPTTDGATMVVVSDVTSIKESESALLTLTEQLKLLATTDGLTGLINRRGFDQVLEKELARCARNHKPLSLLMIDVDSFKAYNDLYGHPAGDKCLRAVAECLKHVRKRPGDSVARYGGEEFAVILPETDEDGAYFIAERLRLMLQELALPHEGSKKRVVTVSIGLSTVSADDTAAHPAELIAKADEALYNAKAAGRNRVAGWRQRHPIGMVRG